MKVMQTFEPLKSKIETIYQKSSFLRKPTLINVLPSQRIGEIRKCLIRKVIAPCMSKIDEEEPCFTR